MTEKKEKEPTKTDGESKLEDTKSETSLSKKVTLLVKAQELVQETKKEETSKSLSLLVKAQEL